MSKHILLPLQLSVVSDMDMETIKKLLEEIKLDRSVPRNIRASVETAQKDLSNEKLEKAVRINSAISLLDEVSNDPNIPIYTRTQIWNIVSMLEVLNKNEE